VLWGPGERNPRLPNSVLLLVQKSLFSGKGLDAGYVLTAFHTPQVLSGCSAKSIVLNKNLLFLSFVSDGQIDPESRMVSGAGFHFAQDRLDFV